MIEVCNQSTQKGNELYGFLIGKTKPSFASH
jgi:hypothetical protein